MSRVYSDNIWEEFSMEGFCCHSGIDHRISNGNSGEQISFKECPFCGDVRHKVFANAETGAGKCFVCDKTFNAYSFIKEYSGLSSPRDVYDVIRRYLKSEGWKPRKVEKSARIDSQSDLIMPLNDPATNHEYLNQRGIDSALVDYFDLRFCKNGYFIHTKPDGSDGFMSFKDRIIIPIYDIEGKLRSFQGRDITNTSERKYLFPPGFASTGSLLYNAVNVLGRKEVVMCEGAFDVFGAKIALDSLSDFRNVGVIGSFGKNLSMRETGGSDQLGELLKMKKVGLQNITIMWDGEAAATSAAIKTALNLIKYGFEVRVAVLPAEKDPGDASVSEILMAYRSAQLITSMTAARMKLRLI